MRGRDSLGVWDGHVHTATFKMGKQQRPTDSTENSAQGSMAAWTGVEFEREWISQTQCMCLAQFLRYLPETIITLFIPIQKSSDSRKFKTKSCPLNAYVDNAVISIFGS